MNPAHITEVTPQNLAKETFYCVKDVLNPGFLCKSKWFNERYKEGLQLSILKDIKGQSIGFIEYLPASKAWRPIIADKYMFIHCMYIYSRKIKNKGYGSQLIEHVEQQARLKKMVGVCVMTSKGPWMADKRIFEKNGYSLISKKDRFELYFKKWDQNSDNPSFIDWSANRSRYQGWHLLYADQCPWHEKSAIALQETARDFGIKLRVQKIESSEEVRKMPSGYGVFNLMHDGRLLEDHYISATRFKTIVQKELARNQN